MFSPLFISAFFDCLGEELGNAYLSQVNRMFLTTTARLALYTPINYKHNFVWHNFL